MAEYSTSEILIFENIPLLRFTLRRPNLGHESIDLFLQELTEKAKTWCKTYLFDSLSSDYSCDPDSRRRFRHRSVYELNICTVSVSEDIIELSLSARLKTPRDLIRQEHFLRFELSCGHILPKKRN